MYVGVRTEANGRVGDLAYRAFKPIQIECAVFSFAWLDELESEVKFDQLFGEAFNEAERTIGKPTMRGMDPVPFQDRWAYWTTTTGLFVVQQSNYDPQFGRDLNFWICPHAAPDPRPTVPFFDWLMRAN